MFHAQTGNHYMSVVYATPHVLEGHVFLAFSATLFSGVMRQSKTMERKDRDCKGHEAHIFRTIFRMIWPASSVSSLSLATYTHVS